MRTKTDKIFDNTFGEAAHEFEANIVFKLDGAFEEKNDMDTIHYYNMLFNDIDVLIKNSEYNKFNEKDENGEYMNLNKSYMNNLFEFILNNIKGHRILDVWFILTNYFAINPNKLYTSLANRYKSKLLSENVKYKKDNEILEKLY